jgi:hypothetical protein
MMAQGVLPFKYENNKQGAGLTAFGGIGVYLDLLSRSGFISSVERHVGLRSEGQGWTDAEMVLTVVLLNLVGGDCVGDVERLESDEGLCRVFGKALRHSLSRKSRSQLKKRWRREKVRSVPSASALFRYLSAFHDRDQERLREPGRAFIPQSNQWLKGLGKVNRDFVGFVQRNRPERIATLDMDATLVETEKRDALWSYKGFRAYQPLNTWWSEQGLVLHTEFRDGNVPAGYEQKRVLQEALRCLPETVSKVRLRSDTAGYQHDLLKYCDREENKRFGRIEFTVSCDVSRDFKKAVAEVPENDWRVLQGRGRDGQRYETVRQWAEVCFVPGSIGYSKKGPEYRYIAIREPMQEQLMLPEMDCEQTPLPFQSMSMGQIKYKVFGIVTNMHWDGQDLIEWHYKRCGRSEEAHSVMKQDLAGGKLPSGDFGENAAWWWMMVLAFNLNAAMKSLILRGQWVSKRLKALRFHLICIAGRVMQRSRQLFVRIREKHLEWFLQIRARIGALAPGPSG